MSERLVVLRPVAAVTFVADACAALADATNERPHDDELVNVYAEMVRAYAHLLRPALVEGPNATARPAVVDHLLERMRQSRAGETSLRLLDIVDQLHGELTREPLVI